ncbi:hypothetical protein CEXT_104771 [Caerostris extrusa]|uniref:Uncharacterized protein n=1 Tax=Caerostris extrusa TaxID=172846 RepID=A0AAV4VMY3_CAEEX|nr:hypothetical protein CEXT_104771 [Caerostris extrusa]
MIGQVHTYKASPLNFQKTVDKNGVSLLVHPQLKYRHLVFFPHGKSRQFTPTPTRPTIQTIFNGPTNGLWHIKITRQNGCL